MKATNPITPRQVYFDPVRVDMNMESYQRNSVDTMKCFAHTHTIVAIPLFASCCTNTAKGNAFYAYTHQGWQEVAINSWLDNLLRTSETCAVLAADKKKGKRM